MLDEKNTERSYLFGRILAIFDKIEEIVQAQSPDRARLTNAKRYFSVFVQQPSKGTQFLYKKIIPYMRKAKRNKELDAKVCNLDAILGKIITAMPEKTYISNKPLDHTFLLGFKAQQYQLNRAAEPKNKTMEAK
jgi:CRISPR-associated protein Csd1